MHSEAADSVLMCIHRAAAHWSAAGLLQTEGLFLRQCWHYSKMDALQILELNIASVHTINSCYSLTRNYFMGIKSSPSSPITATCKISLDWKF